MFSHHFYEDRKTSERERERRDKMKVCVCTELCVWFFYDLSRSWPFRKGCSHRAHNQYLPSWSHLRKWLLHQGRPIIYLHIQPFEFVLHTKRTFLPSVDLTDFLRALSTYFHKLCAWYMKNPYRAYWEWSWEARCRDGGAERKMGMALNINVTVWEIVGISGNCWWDFVPIVQVV